MKEGKGIFDIFREIKDKSFPKKYLGRCNFTSLSIDHRGLPLRIQCTDITLLTSTEGGWQGERGEMPQYSFIQTRNFNIPINWAHNEINCWRLNKEIILSIVLVNRNVVVAQPSLHTTRLNGINVYVKHMKVVHWQSQKWNIAVAHKHSV